MATRTECISTAHESYDKEYKELCDNWRALDQKSQGSLQIAGLMIALLAGFGPRICERHFIADLSTWISIGIGCSAFVLLTASVWLGLLALWVQDIGRAPHGSGWPEIQVLSTEASLSDELLNDIAIRQLSAWQKVVVDVWAINERKAFRLRWAQGLLLAGTCAVTAATVVFTVGQALGHGGTNTQQADAAT